MDGRDGQVCADCGAYLQPVPHDGVEVLRCPWARDYSRSFTIHGITHVYCDRPLGQRSTSVVASYSAPNQRVTE